MDWLQERTGVKTVAIVPMIRHHLPEEDTLHHRAQRSRDKINIALIAYPYASNVDEFDPLIYENGVTVVPLRDRCELTDFQAVILPGSKNTAQSLRYLEETSLAGEVVRAAASGVVIFGVCGGMQLLGRHIADPHGIESGDVAGLGLLDVATMLAIDKTTRQREVRSIDGDLLQGYEIHHGQTTAGPGAHAHLADGLGWQQGNVIGVYLHGLLENTGYRQRFLSRIGWAGKTEDWHAKLGAELDRVAELVHTTGWFPE
jgi:adenosylcobyric acid synthase